MLRISDHEAIRNPVVYLYTVANNLLKEHAVLERRRAKEYRHRWQRNSSAGPDTLPAPYGTAGMKAP
jgi:hypothetical protein